MSDLADETAAEPFITALAGRTINSVGVKASTRDVWPGSEPDTLELHLDDGAIVVVTALGFHDTGGLSIERREPPYVEPARASVTIELTKFDRHARLLDPDEWPDTGGLAPLILCTGIPKSTFVARQTKDTVTLTTDATASGTFTAEVLYSADGQPVPTTSLRRWIEEG